jgi:hypothetical protein
MGAFARILKRAAACDWFVETQSVKSVQREEWEAGKAN